MGFYDNWVKNNDKKGKHFNLIRSYFLGHGSFHGMTTAHAGMWRTVKNIAGNFLGRLAITPMVLATLGLKITPDVIKFFNALNSTYSKEVSHVTYGSKWLHFLY